MCEREDRGQRTENRGQRTERGRQDRERERGGERKSESACVTEVVFKMVADLELYSVCLRLQNYSSLEPCWVCTANRSTRPWTDFNVSHPRREGPLPDHPFFQLLPNRGNLALDTLHVVDLGVAGLVCGGTLKWLCHHLRVPVDQVWGLAREGYRHIGTANKSRLDHLSTGMFLKEPPGTQFACWKAKGAETRHFVPALLFAFARLQLPASGFQRHVLQALSCLTALYAELEPFRALLRLSPPVCRAVSTHIQGLVGALSHLAVGQQALGGLFFNVTPKVHFLVHLGEQAQFHNPLWVTTYQEEDFIGKITRVARMSSSGHTQAQLPSVVIQKYRVLLALMWKGFL